MPRQNNLGSSYRVDFWRRYPDNVIAPAAIELEGGPTPFLHSLSDVDDLLTPLRASTARISFCDDIALGDMLPADGFEWKVILTRLDDGRQMFVGYLTAEVYTQPDIEGPNIVTVNAASPLTPIAATTMKLLGVGSLSIGHLIYSAISECEGIDRVYIPAQYTINKAVSRADFTDILRWQMSSANFIRTTDSGIVTGEDFERDNYAAALEAVCRLFGWCLTDVGDGALYFVSPGYTGEYMQLSKAQLIATEAFTPTMVTPSITNEGYLQPIDKGDTVDFRQGVGSAMIKAQPQSAEVNIPEASSVIRAYEFKRETVTIKSPDSNKSAETAEISTELYPSRLSLYAYALTGANEWQQLASYAEDIANEDFAGIPYGKAGARFLRFDWCNPDDLSPDAEKPKREWNFIDSLVINESADLVDASNPDFSQAEYILPWDLPLIKIDMRGGAFVSGAFVIDFETMASPINGFFIPEDRYWQGGEIVEPKSGVSDAARNVNFPYWGDDAKALSVSLRVGDKYYDGANWTKYFSLFAIPVSSESAQWHPVKSNKTIDMPYEGASGWYIPIDELLTGDIELIIYKSFTDSETVKPYMVHDPLFSYQVKPFVPTIYIKGLSLRHVELYSVKEIVDRDVTFYKDFGSSFTERKEITLPIHSRINSSEQMSLLYDSGVTAIDKVWRTTDVEAAKPEQFLLANVERLFASVSQKWRRGAEIMDLKPIDLFRRVGNKVMAMSGLTFNYAQSVVELNIAEVKSELSIRYVE